MMTDSKPEPVPASTRANATVGALSGSNAASSTPPLPSTPTTPSGAEKASVAADEFAPRRIAPPEERIAAELVGARLLWRRMS